MSIARDAGGSNISHVDETNKDRGQHESYQPWVIFQLGHAGDVSELARLYRIEKKHQQQQQHQLFKLEQQDTKQQQEFSSVS